MGTSQGPPTGSIKLVLGAWHGSLADKVLALHMSGSYVGAGPDPCSPTEGRPQQTRACRLGPGASARPGAMHRAVVPSTGTQGRAGRLPSSHSQDTHGRKQMKNQSMCEERVQLTQSGREAGWGGPCPSDNFRDNEVLAPHLVPASPREASRQMTPAPSLPPCVSLTNSLCTWPVWPHTEELGIAAV